MKRAYLWAVIAAGLLLAGELPMETHDAAELLPAELAIFWTEDGRAATTVRRAAAKIWTRRSTIWSGRRRASCFWTRRSI